MKFGKRLRATVDQSYEDWRPMFMSYKDLKKRLNPKSLADDVDSKDSESRDPHHEDRDSDHETHPISFDKARSVVAVRHAEAHNTAFFARFREEVDKVNDFFLDKQEDYIIEHQQLSAKAHEYCLPGRATRREVMRLRQRLTNFHGELVLLENFSTVNYTGFRKILKKHDKKTGLNMRDIYLKTVLVTPFFLSDTVRKLILTTEAQLARLYSIGKFRRTSPSHVVSPETSIPASQNLSEPASKHAFPIISAPSLPPTASPYDRVLVEYPRPRAFISVRSALWRLYRCAQEHSTRVRTAMAIANDASIPSPPVRLLEMVDAVEAEELGIVPHFMKEVTQSSNYCIAAEHGFSMGFFILMPGTKLQLFKSLNSGSIATRNLRGKAHVACYRTSPKHSDIPEGGDSFCVEETRTGLTTGPWPSVACSGKSMHAEWAAETMCAIFYVASPALMDNVIPRFVLKKAGESKFVVTRTAGHGQSLPRVLC